MWEEFFSEPVSNAHLPGISRIEEPGIGFDGYNACGFSADVQAEDNLHLLINKMMTDNHVNVVGEGYNNSSLNSLDHVWHAVLDMSRQYNGQDFSSLSFVVMSSHVQLSRPKTSSVVCLFYLDLTSIFLECTCNYTFEFVCQISWKGCIYRKPSVDSL